ncbi:hypothetical protein PsorP6_016590 [Peronosclerospora sorghi]|uniref:Uncharacterized protein n=1 Tax=Peronosclerospora sorghi TaxID=230839 RepID=A0ACC0VN39_9STRA|nr:hypothetical protein PsorP6_016590 [Peronosclerospora sorghi]
MVPDACWQHVNMDFFTALLESDGYDATYFVVCPRFNRPCYIPTSKNMEATNKPRLFFDNVARYYSLPDSIVSDRDPSSRASSGKN